MPRRRTPRNDIVVRPAWLTRSPRYGIGTPGEQRNGVQSSCRNLGSRRSRSQSPKKLSDITTRKMAKPGQNEIHHASSINCLPSLTLLPHAGIGSGMPAPRNDRVASVRIDWQLPYPAGRGMRRAPLRSTHRTLSTKLRLSLAVTPAGPGLPGKNDSILPPFGGAQRVPFHVSLHVRGSYI